MARMIQNQLQNIERLEAELWDAADNLRANSKLTAGEYCMPVLGVIFLRHATNRYYAALRVIEADQAAGKMPKRPLTAADFKKRGALLLRRRPVTTNCSSSLKARTSARRLSTP
jgi:type I restriction enzyme M protein